MTRTRKILTASFAALTLGLGVVSTATPAAAWCGPYGCGGWGHHGGYGGGALAAGLIGGLAVGAIAASAASAAPAYDTCVVRQRVYDDFGNYRGMRRVRVAC